MSLAEDMPQCAQIVADFKEEFGSGIKCPFIAENGRMIAAKSFPDKQADAVSIQIYNALKEAN